MRLLQAFEQMFHTEGTERAEIGRPGFDYRRSRLSLMDPHPAHGIRFHETDGLPSLFRPQADPAQ